jgi:hypothetical protein
MDYVGREVDERKFVEETIDPHVWKTLVTSRKTAPVSLFSPKFRVILSTRRVYCKYMLCLGLYPNCS